MFFFEKYVRGLVNASRKKEWPFHFLDCCYFVSCITLASTNPIKLMMVDYTGIIILNLSYYNILVNFKN